MHFKQVKPTAPPVRKIAAVTQKAKEGVTNKRPATKGPANDAHVVTVAQDGAKKAAKEPAKDSSDASTKGPTKDVHAVKVAADGAKKTSATKRPTDVVHVTEDGAKKVPATKKPANDGAVVVTGGAKKESTKDGSGSVMTAGDAAKKGPTTKRPTDVVHVAADGTKNVPATKKPTSGDSGAVVVTGGAATKGPAKDSSGGVMAAGDTAKKGTTTKRPTDVVHVAADGAKNVPATKKPVNGDSGVMVVTGGAATKGPAKDGSGDVMAAGDTAKGPTTKRPIDVVHVAVDGAKNDPSNKGPTKVSSAAEAAKDGSKKASANKEAAKTSPAAGGAASKVGASKMAAPSIIKGPKMIYRAARPAANVARLLMRQAPLCSPNLQNTSVNIFVLASDYTDHYQVFEWTAGDFGGAPITLYSRSAQDTQPGGVFINTPSRTDQKHMVRFMTGATRDLPATVSLSNELILSETAWEDGSQYFSLECRVCNDNAHALGCQISHSNSGQCVKVNFADGTLQGQHLVLGSCANADIFHILPRLSPEQAAKVQVEGFSL